MREPANNSVGAANKVSALRFSLTCRRSTSPLGTMEIESVLVSHPAVAEAAVVGKSDDLKG